MSAVCTITWDWSKGIWTAWPWAQHFSEQGSARAIRNICCCRMSECVSFGRNTWEITQFWKTSLDLYALTGSYRCFGYWLNSIQLNGSSPFHKWRRINEKMHVDMKQIAVCLWKEGECGLFSVQLQPAGFFLPSLPCLIVIIGRHTLAFFLHAHCWWHSAAFWWPQCFISLNVVLQLWIKFSSLCTSHSLVCLSQIEVRVRAFL